MSQYFYSNNNLGPNVYFPSFSVPSGVITISYGNITQTDLSGTLNVLIPGGSVDTELSGSLSVVPLSIEELSGSLIVSQSTEMTLNGSVPVKALSTTTISGSVSLKAKVATELTGKVHVRNTFSADLLTGEVDVNLVKAYVSGSARVVRPIIKEITGTVSNPAVQKFITGSIKIDAGNATLQFKSLSQVRLRLTLVMQHLSMVRFISLVCKMQKLLV